MVSARLWTRQINTLWLDELAELGSLSSLKYLIGEYLPKIPGGAPGHYLIVYPLQKIFPYNKFILGTPGLVLHILVFLLIPTVIKNLQILSAKGVSTAALVARIGFAFEPTLTFQSMEIRPWGFLPFFWILLIMVIFQLIRLDSLDIKKQKLTCLLLGFILWIAFIMHYYVAIMALSICCFFLFQQKKFHLAKLIRLPAFYVLLITCLLAFPFWLYFLKDSFIFGYDTVKTVPIVLMQIYALDKGFPKGIFVQNVVYFGFILFMMGIIISVIGSFFTQKLRRKNMVYTNSMIVMLWFLVFLPIGIIFSLDLYAKYMFLYRQIVWVMLPFYIAIGVGVARILAKNNY